jgi:hypothetical protein
VFPKVAPARPWEPPADRTDLKKVFWRHRGYRVEINVPDWMNTWTRQRILAPRDGPPELVEVDLGAGVQASVSVTLLADDFGTLPYVAGREPYAPEHTPHANFTGNDRATRLA